MRDAPARELLPPPAGTPYVVGPAGGPTVLLLHGLTGAPAEMWPLACGLAAAGWRAEAPLWPGHGTRPEDLAHVSADDLLGAVGRLLCARERPPAAVAGLSMGALLAVVAAANEPGVQALVALAPAVRLRGRAALFDMMGLFPWGPRALVPKGRPDPGEAAAPPSSAASGAPAARAAASALIDPSADGRYGAIPLRWARELRRIRQAALAAASRVRCPTLLVHGLADRTAAPLSVLELRRRLVGAPASLCFVPEGGHLLPLGAGRAQLAARVAAFLAPAQCAAPIVRIESA